MVGAGRPTAPRSSAFPSVVAQLDTGKGAQGRWALRAHDSAGPVLLQLPARRHTQASACPCAANVVPGPAQRFRVVPCWRVPAEPAGPAWRDTWGRASLDHRSIRLSGGALD